MIIKMLVILSLLLLTVHAIDYKDVFEVDASMNKDSSVRLVSNNLFWIFTNCQVHCKSLPGAVCYDNSMIIEFPCVTNGYTISEYYYPSMSGSYVDIFYNELNANKLLTFKINNVTTIAWNNDDGYSIGLRSRATTDGNMNYCDFSIFSIHRVDPLGRFQLSDDGKLQYLDYKTNKWTNVIDSIYLNRYCYTVKSDNPKTMTKIGNYFNPNYQINLNTKPVEIDKKPIEGPSKIIDTLENKIDANFRYTRTSELSNSFTLTNEISVSRSTGTESSKSLSFKIGTPELLGTFGFPELELEKKFESKETSTSTTSYVNKNEQSFTTKVSTTHEFDVPTGMIVELVLGSGGMVYEYELKEPITICYPEFNRCKFSTMGITGKLVLRVINERMILRIKDKPKKTNKIEL